MSTNPVVFSPRNKLVHIRALLSSLIVAALLLFSWNANASESILGEWVTIDDKTNQPKSHVKIYKVGDVYYGKITKLLTVSEDKVCDRCKGSKKDQKILGMTILWGLEQDDDEWSGGKILDPKNGKTYRCKIWLEDGELKVRGYLGPFFRTQTWRPL